MDEQIVQSQDTVHGGIGKVTRYGWKVRDRKGEFRYITKSSLHIDHESYQREPWKDKVLEIASNWSWVACGCLCVAERPGAGLWVIDGQYRLLAALRRDDIHDLPCMVFHVQDIPEEARGFINVNTLRKPMSVGDQFKALVTGKEEAAVWLSHLLEQHQRIPRNLHNGVSCLGEMLRIARGSQEDRQRLFDLFPLLHKLHGEEPISASLLKALMVMEVHMCEGESLTHGRWFRRILEVGLDELNVAMRKAVHYHGRGRSEVLADGVLQRLNKSVRHKFKLAVVLAPSDE